MRKSQIIRYVWLLTLSATALTLFLAYCKLLGEPFSEFLIVIEGSVIAGLILTDLAERTKKPTISITPLSKMLDAGFSIEVKDKTVKNATVFCDNTKINWKELDGTEKVTKDLRAGEVSYFYPFKIVLLHKELTNDKQIISLSIRQKMVTYGENYTEEFERPVYVAYVNLPRGAFSTLKLRGFHAPRARFYCNVRITGEGIEERIDCLLDFACTFYFGRDAESDRVEDISVRCDFGRTKSFIL